jgi:hypothetical protein
MKLQLTATALVFALLAGFAFGPAGWAYADTPQPRLASCMGHEASHISPPGSSSEPGAENGMSGVAKIFHTFGLTTTFAKARLPSHAACDAALLP